jgi:hypothetical protein
MSETVSFPFHGTGEEVFQVVSQAFYTGDVPNRYNLHRYLNTMPPHVAQAKDYFDRQTDGFNFQAIIDLFPACSLEQWTFMTQQDPKNPSGYFVDALNIQIIRLDKERRENEYVSPPGELLFPQLYFLYCIRLEQEQQVYSLCPFPIPARLGAIQIIRRIDYRAVVRTVVERPATGRARLTHAWINPLFFSAVSLNLSPTVSGKTDVSITWTDQLFARFGGHLLELLGGKQEMSDAELTNPVESWETRHDQIELSEDKHSGRALHVFELAVHGTQHKYPDIQGRIQRQSENLLRCDLSKNFVQVAQFTIFDWQQAVIVQVQWLRAEVLPFAQEFYRLLHENAGLSIPDWVVSGLENAEPAKGERNQTVDSIRDKRGMNANTESKVREAHKQLKEGATWSMVRKICSYETYIRWCEHVTGEQPITKL